MKIEEIAEVNKWFKDSELAELEFKKGEYKVALVKEGENKGGTKISSGLSSVVSPEIGVFSFTSKGKSSRVKEGMSVKKGNILGYVRIMNKEVEVVSSVDGKLKVICVNDGDVVEYGQLLFILE